MYAFSSRIDYWLRIDYRLRNNSLDVCIFRTTSNRPTNWRNFKTRLLCRGDKTYVSTIYWYDGSITSDLTRTTNSQKEILHKLLYNMTRTLPPDAYRRYANKHTYTIVEITYKGCNYRIDNQTRLILSDPEPKLNIHYQIAGNSHAIVLVKMKPTECPPDIKVGLVDEDQTFGFPPGSTVMGFIEEALKYSANNKCYTNIEWTIKEVERKKSQSKHESSNRSVSWSGNGLKELGAATVAAAKVAAKITAAQGTKVALTKVPLVGLGCAAVFGVGRLIKGDTLGALGEVTSGAASCIPGVGTAASCGVDALLLARDVKK